MINNASYIISQGTMPYENLALEEVLLSTVAVDEVILYLWQNQNTVVIGRNQNVYKECRVDELQTNGGHLARRLSGGGAVFHDLGNLNFTFILHKDNYDLERQLEVILRAVRSFGVAAEMSGRNDLIAKTAEAFGKFSGNAFYKKGEYWYHHGTILVSARLDQLTRFLTVSPQKLKSNGVASVRSRVVNLSELSAAPLSVSELLQKLIVTFKEVYHLTPTELDKDRINPELRDSLVAKFASDAWRFGNEPKSSTMIMQHFDWGNLELHFLISKSNICSIIVYTDSLDTDLPKLLSKILVGAEFTSYGISKAFTDYPHDDKVLSDIAKAIDKWFK